MKADVLVVDDERINLKLIEGILKNQNLNLVLASDGREALQAIDRHDFAVALLDIMMPDMDGFELAEKLRDDERSRTMPIIFITAISKEQRHVFRGYELGAVDYLFKPVEPEILRSKVTVFADLHRNKRTLEKTTRRLEAVVGELEASRRALEKSEQRYRMVADYNYDWESWISPDGSFTYVSPSCERISGYTPSRFLDDPEFLGRIIHHDDLSAWQNFMFASSTDDSGLTFRIYHNDARVRWISMVKHAISSDEGKDLGIRMSMRDITSRKRMEEQLKHSQLHDPLTGLPNRGLFLDRVERAIDHSGKNGNYFTVLFINIDRFQVINDHYGHTTGDKVLVRIATLLAQVVRTGDTLARFGGDEFVILMEDLPRKADVRDAVRAVQAAFEEPLELEGSRFAISASMGFQITRNSEVDKADLVHNAQLAMYKAKSAGKNRSREYSPRMREGIVNILAVENDLKRALSAGEFEPFFQPLVNLADGTLYGFEALARWRHPERGLVGPGEFIPVAEETGLIVPLGVQVLHDACASFRQWRERYAGAESLTLAVNISAKQFGEPSLVHDVRRILEETTLPSHRLKLEITETVVMLDAMKSTGRLNGLKALGIMLAIDDFGTGYSSMSYLQKFPVDQLKIDLSFVRHMEKAPENIEIIRAMVNMAHSLRLQVVAEGIETERQRDLLYSLQCDYGQGYLYSKPVPADQAEDMVQKYMNS
ncbi:EAL domain-containing protein [Pseudodesulfovibrio sp.]|uniref:putative bifunctional diguanylate cyclase/phosphodiesterase n=1 Tax=Pseudodesulfovibrio sp. TaxID=2035812 RepID=UPI0026392BE7|nr:EAL domain-containing protein [Pseudodesulfovibrio sp.]MDD3312583.1 EAL domain-containing protein [Pseudodesulfovibrio sp.]